MTQGRILIEPGVFGRKVTMIVEPRRVDRPAITYPDVIAARLAAAEIAAREGLVVVDMTEEARGG